MSNPRNEKKKHRVLVLAGSVTDRPQLARGLRLLVDSPDVVYLGAVFASIHRNTEWVQAMLRVLAGQGVPPAYSNDELLGEIYALVGDEPIDVLVAGAGWANHLTGCVAAFLRYIIRCRWPVVVGFAPLDLDESRDSELRQRHNAAAVLSMTEVPGTDVICRNTTGQVFVGSDGFLDACQRAIDLDPMAGGGPSIPKPKPPTYLNPAATAAWLLEDGA